ncbi:hypothetical protein [Opitutus terrae]|uniref:Uncharacterized protein n=1 Tax=Opitutus terrae (strain DSM 11246 / JCM 15787 / PB90-1) TaxID=452637 RepID=B1ZUA2_OPITP|nr:hypothetical protein [Opitutus terrae]ACB76664.1 hypothetical protein Oter_3387 [Opitutus terrae PB90-1]
MKSKHQDEHPLAAPITLVGYIVTQGGKPCTLANVTGSHKGGLLLPGAPVVQFLKPRDAKRAIARTTRAADALRGSLVDTWERLHSLFHGGVFEVHPLGRQL